MDEIVIDVIRDLVNRYDINHICEIGSGKNTIRIRNILRERGIGYVTSLEDNFKYFQLSKDLCEDDEFGKICFVGYEYDYENKKIFYDTDIDKKIDLLLIDGPDGIIMNTFPNYFSAIPSKHFKNKKQGGLQSVFVVDALNKYLRSNCFILVDSRISSVLYFVEKYDLICCSMGKKTVGIKKLYSKKFSRIANNIQISAVSLLRRRNS